VTELNHPIYRLRAHCPHLLVLHLHLLLRQPHLMLLPALLLLLLLPKTRVTPGPGADAKSQGMTIGMPRTISKCCGIWCAC
jgi:hypothetical protein